ncbi:hypothetical protein [Hymenobacter volaticus]|uniref:GHKL domain-containing protein n=1 Tax=Hymenobacter volaticus TaxID=2932254 RepID=A0ABY4GF44_9BACT|nr:hypothetical protein [Hymenobacter volaticus]UOQ69410.1 hypothetical protein MUN86_27375 [Hymenobacter volaticus]
MKVKVEVKEDALTFSVQNPIRKNAATPLEEPGGIGLPNVRKRLSLLYPDQHTLAIQTTGDTFKVLLSIHGLHIQAHERQAHLLHY